jgi:hypothetical protein
MGSGVGGISSWGGGACLKIFRSLLLHQQSNYLSFLSSFGLESRYRKAAERYCPFPPSVSLWLGSALAASSVSVATDLRRCCRCSRYGSTCPVPINSLIRYLYTALPGIPVPWATSGQPTILAARIDSVGCLYTAIPTTIE